MYCPKCKHKLKVGDDGLYCKNKKCELYDKPLGLVGKLFVRGDIVNVKNLEGKNKSSRLRSKGKV